ncbi:MAG: preprotein translocase subunit SecE [Planctomycetaceae bacterium]
MARVKDDRTFWSSLGSMDVYKRNQGRLSRQLTAIALAAIVLLGCWTLTQTILSTSVEGWESNWDYIRYGIPALLGGIGLWAVYRFVNYPRFADFLISVEAEMDKVSWAGQTYLVRATGVVLGTMLVLGLFLLACDMVWSWLFELIGFLRVTSA